LLIAVVTFITVFITGLTLTARYGDAIERGLTWFEDRLGRTKKQSRQVDARRGALNLGSLCTVLVAIGSLVLAVSIGPPTGLPGDEPEAKDVDTSRVAHPAGLEVENRVANVTTGDTEYFPFRDALVDDVLKVQLGVRNTNETGLPITGVGIALGVPDDRGTKQELGANISASRGVNLNPTAIVELSLDDARLRYVPGSLKLRHNVARAGESHTYVTEELDDSVLLRDSYAMGDLAPGEAFTITYLVRSVATAVSIVAAVREIPAGAFAAKSGAEPGASVQYRIVAQNKGNEPLREVLMHANLPPNVAYVPGSTMVVVGDELGEVPDGIVDFSSPSRAPSGRGVLMGKQTTGPTFRKPSGR